MAKLQAFPLTPRQQRFVDEFIVGGNATEAARRAGYSERTARQIAAENLSKPDIQAAIESARRREANYWQIQRRDVIEALLGAIEMAKAQVNPGAMIRGLTEIAKMLGYYEPQKMKVELTDNAAQLKAKFEVMSDEELLTIIARAEQGVEAAHNRVLLACPAA